MDRYAVATYDINCHAWTVIETPALAQIGQLVFGARSNEFYGEGPDKTIVSLRAGEPPKVVGQGRSPDYSPQGGLAYVASDERSVVVQASETAAARVIRGPGAELGYWIAWSPDARFIFYRYLQGVGGFYSTICGVSGIGCVEVATGINYKVLPSPLITDLGPIARAKPGGPTSRLDGVTGMMRARPAAELDPALWQTLVRLEKLSIRQRQ
jgi:hypothetical protein